MTNSFIKNRGITQTLIHNNNGNNNNNFSEINWEADYNGKLANINLLSNINGNKEFYNVSLNNEDLNNLLSIPSINNSLETRLKSDFNKKRRKKKVNLNLNLNRKILSPILNRPDIITSYLSSPLPEEELIIPKSIINNNPSYNKNNKTYKVYKKIKSTFPKSRHSFKHPKKTSFKSNLPNSWKYSI